MSDAMHYDAPDSGDRNGQWMPTWSGKVFWPMDARVEDVSPVDIAIGLSRSFRWAGQSDDAIDVASHSINVALTLSMWGHPAEVQLYGLLHDGSEAYLHDIIRPLKMMDEFAPYRECEVRLQRTIYAAFGLHDDEPGEVKDADDAVMLCEAAKHFAGYYPALLQRRSMRRDTPLPGHCVARTATPIAWMTVFRSLYAEVHDHCYPGSIAENEMIRKWATEDKDSRLG